MREITGNLWNYYNRDMHVIGLTTNGMVKTNGECVMGRGCAREAVLRIPGIARQLGTAIRENGNIPVFLDHGRILTFPVKHHWRDMANLDLISESAERWAELTHDSPYTYILPRPGCGNGHRLWIEVLPLLEGLPDNVHVITF